MVEELGLEPGRALQELERAILAQDPALEPPTAGSRPPPATVARRSRRGGWLIAAAGAVLLAAIAAAAVKLSGSGAGSVRVPANSVAVIDPRSNSVVASAPVGESAWRDRVRSGSLWVANVDDQTVSRIDPAIAANAAHVPARRTPQRVWPRARARSGWRSPIHKRAACR